MSSFSVGKNIKVSIFGESHGAVIGGVIDGLPYGQKIDMNKLQEFMKRRSPGYGKYITKRRERDEIQFLSGIKNNTIMGDPIAILIENNDVVPDDYKDLVDIPRPSHVDFAAKAKFGEDINLSGGGHFSGRLTAVLTAFGGIAKQILEKENIHVSAHLYRIRDFVDKSHSEAENIERAMRISENNKYYIIDENGVESIDKIFEELRKEKDSTGGIVECSVIGLRSGIGDPIFDGIENRISRMIFAIPGIKGIEFGSGFDGSLKLGSENNDEFYISEGEVKTTSNNSGGILGGMSNGMPINLKVAFKPTPSIGKGQNSINLKTGKNVIIEIKGRHDPCIAIRGVVVVESVVSLVILDYLINELII